MAGEIIQTSKGPRVRRGSFLVPLETQQRLEAENSERLRARHADPDQKAILSARMKGLWADPIWSAEFKRQQSARITAINDAIDRDPERREKRASYRRGLLTELNKDPEFQRRRREGAKAGYAKRDDVALAAHHKHVTVKTMNGPVVMRAYQARLFEQFRLAVGDTAALALVIKPPRRRKKPQAARVTLLAEQAARTAVLLNKLAPAIAAAFGITVEELCSETRDAPEVAQLRRMLMLLLLKVYGRTTASTASALRRTESTIRDAVIKMRRSIAESASARARFEKMRKTARAVVRPRNVRRQVASGKAAA